MTHRPRSMFARWARRLAGAATLVLVAGTTTVLGQAPAGAAVACEVTYTANEWTSGPNQGGFTANLTLKNLGDPLTAWTLAFDFPTTTQRYTPTGWSANWSQSGTRVTATNMPLERRARHRRGISIGFNGTWSGSNPKPDHVLAQRHRLRRHERQPPPTVSLTSPAAGQPFTAPADRADRRDRRRPGRHRSPRSSSTTTDCCSAPTPPRRTRTAGRTCRPGNYSIQARAYDNAGATATSTPVGSPSPPTAPARAR